MLYKIPKQQRPNCCNLFSSFIRRGGEAREEGRGGGEGGTVALALIKILINTHQGNFTKMVFNARQP